MNQLTAIDVLRLIKRSAQSMREEGESDLRSIIWMASYLIKCAEEGKDREIVIAEAEEQDNA